MCGCECYPFSVSYLYLPSLLLTLFPSLPSSPHPSSIHTISAYLVPTPLSSLCFVLCALFPHLAIEPANYPKSDGLGYLRYPITDGWCGSLNCCGLLGIYGSLALSGFLPPYDMLGLAGFLRFRGSLSDSGFLQSIGSLYSYGLLSSCGSLSAFGFLSPSDTLASIGFLEMLDSLLFPGFLLHYDTLHLSGFL